MEKIVWLNSDRKSEYDDHYKLLIESGMYVEEPVPPVVDLNNKDSEVTRYYLLKLKEEYKGVIIIVDNKQVFISKDNR